MTDEDTTQATPADHEQQSDDMSINSDNTEVQTVSITGLMGKMTKKELIAFIKWSLLNSPENKNDLPSPCSEKNPIADSDIVLEIAAIKEDLRRLKTAEKKISEL